ncbi:MAG TPA: 50S ribosomal protein L15 [Candidatus Paceibacterota bacterium]|jgi:large subunit ribosomal protein L15|nr:50S ribosomal protein L15 [Candidatus Paceibacterota bacterium]
MQLNDLKRPAGIKRPYRRVGRGQSSSRGKQSGRGGKGQSARAGHKIRPALRDIIKKLPKRRGYGKNRGRTHVPRPVPVAISLDRLEKMFDSGAEVSRKSLIEKGMLSARGNIRVKVVGQGTLSKKLSFVGVAASGSAKAAIEKAGGTVSAQGGSASGRH